MFVSCVVARPQQFDDNSDEEFQNQSFQSFQSSQSSSTQSFGGDNGVQIVRYFYENRGLDGYKFSLVPGIFELFVA